MIFSFLDLFILKEILSSSDTTTWRMAKKFDWNSNAIDKNDYYYREKCNRIIKRLKIMEKEGLVVITKEKGKNVYNLRSDRVLLKNIRFPDCRISSALFIKEKDKKWQIFQM